MPTVHGVRGQQEGFLGGLGDLGMRIFRGVAGGTRHGGHTPIGRLAFPVGRSFPAPNVMAWLGLAIRSLRATLLHDRDP